MTLIHASTYEKAYLWAKRNHIDEWAYVYGPEDVTKHRDFHFVSLTPISKSMEYALSYVKASGGRVTFA